MDYGELIAELYRRSGQTIKDYAENIGVSTAHMSNILAGKQRGTPKVFEDALTNAGYTVRDLHLPDLNAAEQGEKEWIRVIRSLSEQSRESLLLQARRFAFLERQSRVAKNKK